MKDDGKNDNNELVRERMLRPRGDYHKILSYQKAEVIYDITFRFCQRFFSKYDLTVDQMVKPAITSKETEIKLTNVARASFEELLEDYHDYLRVRDFQTWDKDSKEALFTRDLGRKKPLTFETYRKYVGTRPADIVANIAICVIFQTNFLLDHQIRRLEAEFLQQGGLRERMTRTRRQLRGQERK